MDSCPTVEMRNDEPVPMTAVLDTLEVRWFADGEVPIEVVEWFTDHGRVEPTEERCDSYRNDGLVDTGVKLRARHLPELKSRLAVFERVTFGREVTGAPELWRRWSPADAALAMEDRSEWLEVSKRIVKRRFDRDGTETVLSSEFPASGGCDAEIVAIKVGELEAWSFALAAFGAPEMRRDSLLASWQALNAGGAPPAAFAHSLSKCAGYAGWLAALGQRTHV